MASEQAFNVQFVLEVEKYPCLYNYKLPNYVRKDVVDKAWNAIGQKFNLTGAQCKERWRNIRNVFVRHLKPGKSGSGQRNIKPYYLSEVMQFTLPFIKLSSQSVSGNLPMPMDTDPLQIMDENSDEEGAEIHAPVQGLVLNHMASPRPAPSPVMSPLSISINTMPSTSSSSPQYQPIETPSPSISLPTPSPSTALLTPSSTNEDNSRLTTPKQKGSKRKNLDEGILDYLRMKQARMTTNRDLEQHPKKMFLLSLLPDLEAMTDRQMRMFKQKVIKLIDDILEEPENQPMTLYYETIAEGTNEHTQNN